MKQPYPYFLYILKCKDGTYYTGSTNNLELRLKLHNSGKGAKYLRGRGPARLVYVKRYESLSRALKAEIKVKALSREKKMEMVKSYQSVVVTFKRLER